MRTEAWRHGERIGMGKPTCRPPPRTWWRLPLALLTASDWEMMVPLLLGDATGMGKLACPRPPPTQSRFLRAGLTAWLCGRTGRWWLGEITITAKLILVFLP